jgi:hypothetical protein
MVGAWSKQGGRYLCAMRYPRYAPGACTGRSLSAATIEQTVWEHVQALLADPEVLRQQYEQGHGDPAVDVRAEHACARLERKLNALEETIVRMPGCFRQHVPHVRCGGFVGVLCLGLRATCPAPRVH